MLSEQSSSLADLDPDVRFRLAQLLEKRNRYLSALQHLNGLRMTMLVAPSKESEQAVAKYNAKVLVPLREVMKEDVVFLVAKAVDIEQMIQMLPMVVAGLMQSVDLPLLLATYGFEPDVVDKIMMDISKYIQSGV